MSDYSEPVIYQLKVVHNQDLRKDTIYSVKLQDFLCIGAPYLVPLGDIAAARLHQRLNNKIIITYAKTL